MFRCNKAGLRTRRVGSVGLEVGIDGPAGGGDPRYRRVLLAGRAGGPAIGGVMAAGLPVTESPIKGGGPTREKSVGGKRAPPPMTNNYGTIVFQNMGTS